MRERVWERTEGGEKDLHQYDWSQVTLKTSLDSCRQIPPVNDIRDELNGIIHPQTPIPPPRAPADAR